MSGSEETEFSLLKTIFGGRGMLGSAPGRGPDFFVVFFFMVFFVMFETIKELLDVAGWPAGGQSEKFTQCMGKRLSAISDGLR